MNNNLKVKVKNKTCGKLLHENTEYIFSYDSEDDDDFISLTMPVRAKDYVHTQLHPVFEMHLPEGYLLSIIKKHFSKFEKTDDFGLLRLISSKIEGRVSYEKEIEGKPNTLTLEHLLHSNNDNLFDELVTRFALNSAISGVQPKVLAKVEDKATLSFKEYIVKSWGNDYPHLALNEYYCMLVVKKANLSVAEFYISDDAKLFVMKRFDILENNESLGFEDMCVLQAKAREDKYQGSYEQIAKTIKIFVSAKNKKVALRDFFKMIVINNLVKNGDAHLKNFGLLYADIDNIRLAPAYDVVCTTLYINHDIPALHLLGSKKWWEKKFLLRFGKESCGLSPKEVNDLYDECLNALQEVCYEIENKIKDETNSETQQFLQKLLVEFTL